MHTTHFSVFLWASDIAFNLLCYNKLYFSSDLMERPGRTNWSLIWFLVAIMLSRFTSIENWFIWYVVTSIDEYIRNIYWLFSSASFIIMRWLLPKFLEFKAHPIVFRSFFCCFSQICVFKPKSSVFFHSHTQFDYKLLVANCFFLHLE